MPRAGLEPAREPRAILSRLRLPVPPPRLGRLQCHPFTASKELCKPPCQNRIFLQKKGEWNPNKQRTSY